MLDEKSRLLVHVLLQLPLENAHGRVVRLDAATGREVWAVELLERFGGSNITWGLSECLRVDERAVYATISAQTGEVLYTLPDTTKGAPLIADGRIYALCEDGWMLLLEAGERQFTTHGRFRFAKADGRDAWAHPALLDGRLYLRHHEKLVCYDVRKKP